MTAADERFWLGVREILDDLVGGDAYDNGATWRNTATPEGMDAWFRQEDHPRQYDMAMAFLDENVKPWNCRA